MARSFTSTLRTATDNKKSYVTLARLEVYPSRIFFESITSDYAVAGADAQGIVDDPMYQDIEYNATAGGLVTFWCDGDLKYAIQGSTTVTTTTTTSSVKPGVLGSKIYVYDGTYIDRYSINWSSIASRSTTPFSDDSWQIEPSLTIDAIHAISSTEYVAIARDEGGFRPIYVSGVTQYPCDVRFMFPKIRDWDGSDRTMREMAVFSSALKLDNKIFVYMSNAPVGTVDGIYYDLDTGTWSDFFVSVPTDLQVSQCHFRISNAYEHNGTAYICGQFVREDAYETSQPYSLLLYSQDGKTFAIDRFTLVADIGYRFLARVGSDDNLYLGNCNRICYDDVTWVFDGVNGTAALKLDISSDDIRKISDSNLSSLKVSLRAGAEEYFDDDLLIEEARVLFYVGLTTTAGNEEVLYGTYILDKMAYAFGSGRRDHQMECIGESEWKLTGLTMPFYAELFGKSSMYDPMTEESGKLYTAPGGTHTVDFFQVDFWQHEAYDREDIEPQIQGEEFYDSGGVNFSSKTGAHNRALITKGELKSILGLSYNPKITAESFNVKLYGWSHPISAGNPNDTMGLILVTEDEDGNEDTHIIYTNTHFPKTYPDTASGSYPVVVPVTGMTIGHYIKKVGMIFTADNGTWFCPARVEFPSDVEVPVNFSDANTPWEVQDDGTFKIPSPGRPFIMFSQKPYNAFNFCISGMFENTIAEGISGYAVGAGVLGHAENANNFTLARFDVVSGKAQLVLSRAGIETVLSEATPGWSVGTLNGILFTHKGGLFTIYIYNETNERFESVLTYEWEDADGFMYTSETATMKCGIYGAINAPYVRTLGSYTGSLESRVASDGLPVDPMYTFSDFPSSGQLYIRGNIYSYSYKINHPTHPRGPYQVRQNGVYNPPIGIGPGVVTRDFDWTASTSSMNGYLIATSAGSSFICNGALWKVFDYTGGSKVYYPNRARFYSSNSQIANAYFTLATRVWIVGGFAGFALISGDRTRIAVGETAILNLEGEIKCYWYMGSGGPDDTTISDLISSVCNLSGATANFPNDEVQASLVVSGPTSIFDDYYADGFDLRYQISTPTTHSILTNVKINGDNYEEKDLIENDTGIEVAITYAGSGNYDFQFISTPSDTVMFAFRYAGSTGVQKYRIMFHEDFISIYQNGAWVITVAFDELLYGQNENYINIDADGSFTMSNIVVRELGDWREAIYIDLETDGRSALSSIIQERPVEMSLQPDGSLDFWYDFVGDTITQVIEPRSHEYVREVPTDGASDAIVYGNKEVKTLQYPDFAKVLGFATKLMRLPNLNTGAIKAAMNMLRKQYESRRRHSIITRPDFSLEIGDKYSMDYEVSGTERNILFDIIIEAISLSLSMDDVVSSSMHVQGRETE